MLVLTLRTDKPEAEIGLYEDGKKLAYEEWHAHRTLSETIHSKLEEMLKKTKHDWSDITGVVVYKGPGSFTGLRIGLSVANALAYGNKIPIVGETGDNWIEKGLQRIGNGENETNTLPEYGAEPHITQQKK